MKELEWIWDFYFSHLFYNERKAHYYHEFMTNKWGKRYTDTLQEDHL